MGIKMKDGDTSRALLSAYHRSIAGYQKLLKTHVTDVERNYIMERLSACHAAVQALIGSESTKRFGVRAIERKVASARWNRVR
jgi:hypothetical protein